LNKHADTERSDDNDEMNVHPVDITAQTAYNVWKRPRSNQLSRNGTSRKKAAHSISARTTAAPKAMV
jgi:hypothetical protein